MGERKSEHEGLSDTTAHFIEVDTNAQRGAGSSLSLTADPGPSVLSPTQQIH